MWSGGGEKKGADIAVDGVLAAGEFTYERLQSVLQTRGIVVVALFVVEGANVAVYGVLALGEFPFELLLQKIAAESLSVASELLHRRLMRGTEDIVNLQEIRCGQLERNPLTTLFTRPHRPFAIT